VAAAGRGAVRWKVEGEDEDRIMAPPRLHGWRGGVPAEGGLRLTSYLRLRHSVVVCLVGESTERRWLCFSYVTCLEVKIESF
jgi:hypothetical protein